MKLSIQNRQEIAASKPGGHELQVRKGSSTYQVQTHSSGAEPSCKLRFKDNLLNRSRKVRW